MDDELTPDELDRAGRRMVRHAWVILGYVPLPEMTPEEVERHLRFRMTGGAPDDDDEVPG